MVELVWFPLAIQKHAFMEWLTLKNRLTTKNRPIQWGFFGDSYCAFCRNKIESRNICILSAPLPRGIWKHVMGLHLVTDVPIIWDEIVQWGATNLEGKSFIITFCKMV